MRLVLKQLKLMKIRARGSCAGGLGRYSGSGMFNAICRQLFSSGFKKVVDAVVNGSTSTSQKVQRQPDKKLQRMLLIML